jgi:DNA repair exonuclease SbcCD nuclease subunit
VSGFYFTVIAAMKFRFGILSDPHIAVPSTIHYHPSRFHRVEISIPAIEQVLSHFEAMGVDFVLIPGDLTQDGEPENHQWLGQRLQRCPFPVYVLPGNHDIPTLTQSDRTIAAADFPHYYRYAGYADPSRLYYHQEILPQVHLIALNSNCFDDQEQPIGAIDLEQWHWLEQTLDQCRDRLTLVALHHNVIEHLPGQTQHELGRRYMIQDAPKLLNLLQSAGIQLIFTGHLHVQDLAQEGDIYEITTGSLVSYPHPYRLIEMETNEDGGWTVHIQSFRVETLPDFLDLQHQSRQWMGDRFEPFMLRLLTAPPLSLDPQQVSVHLPHLRYFWADVAAGDGMFDYPDFPDHARQFFRSCGAINSQGQPLRRDNHARLQLKP